MASTDLITYLNYMSTWETESDENIDRIISEQALFVNLGEFDSDKAVNAEFTTLHDLACEVRDRTIAADATQIAADAAAVAAIWSFGLGMAAFAALQAAEIIQQKVISSKSTELNNKLTSADTDISAQINPNVSNYVATYKKNNDLIVSKAPVGLDTRTCRGLLLQFLAQVQRNTTLDAGTFKQYAGSARRLYDSDEINAVYDALDTLNLSKKTDADVKKFMDFLAGWTFPGKAEISMVQNACIAIMFYKLKIANDTIRAQAEAAGLPVEEVDATAFGAMDAVGKFITVVAVVMSVADMVFEILDIENVVTQCQKMCDQLDGPIKQSYLDYFNGIKTAARAYKAAIQPDSGNSAGRDIQQMNSQIQQWGSITQFGIRIAEITGTADNPAQTSGTATKTDHGFSGYNGTWEIGNWGDTLKFTN
ncbi:hypothetical protein A5724_04100 [Mycobacterium sp. ACS1612]|uniref:hypothetical protein n=1 Tax=Mycobacterium sp. ACS1612 TaxID=1834117 RepID=UPI0007FD4018|nr:hypothetical protein [Mycobacterium sp. ACS1612]OBF25578.1 hypothetical protein A5724_04100 [Mycobacterium sp. ACS1612]